MWAFVEMKKIPDFNQEIISQSHKLTEFAVGHFHFLFNN
jgi:hypothetical protein